MGQRLMNIMGMKENKSYKNAIATMRTISKNIDYAFGKAYKACELYVGRMTESVKPGYKGKLIRGIIRAGDDITFICNVKVAFGCVKAFIYEVSKHVLYENKAYTRQENIKEYGFQLVQALHILIAIFLSEMHMRLLKVVVSQLKIVLNH